MGGVWVFKGRIESMVWRCGRVVSIGMLGAGVVSLTVIEGEGHGLIVVVVVKMGVTTGRKDTFRHQ